MYMYVRMLTDMHLVDIFFNLYQSKFFLDFDSAILQNIKVGNFIFLRSFRASR